MALRAVQVDPCQRPGSPADAPARTAALQWNRGRHRERVISWAGALSSFLSGNLRDRGTTDEDAMELPEASHTSLSGLPSDVGTSTGRFSRRSRARRAALRYVAVWTAVAALALLAQAVAPAAAP